ncbi:MAG: hypothetical protein AB7R55_03990 [Gemmatimonadales bacterium]
MRSALAALAISGLMANPAEATDCTVNALTAYLQAVKKGWTFTCTWTGGSTKPTFIPLVPDGLACIGKNAGWPNGRSTVIMASFFTHQSWSVYGGLSQAPKYRKLHNDWTLIDYDAIGHQYTRYYDEPHTLVKFITTWIAPDRSYKLVVKNLVLRKDGGVCSKAIAEAF